MHFACSVEANGDPDMQRDTKNIWCIYFSGIYSFFKRKSLNYSEGKKIRVNRKSKIQKRNKRNRNLFYPFEEFFNLLHFCNKNRQQQKLPNKRFILRNYMYCDTQFCSFQTYETRTSVP